MRYQPFSHHRQRVTPWHAHDDGQLYWAVSGLIMIETGQAQWTVTPGTVGWLPPGVRHRAAFPGEMRGGGLFFAATACRSMPAEAGIFGASAFLVSLITRLSASVSQGRSQTCQANLLAVLSDEMACASPSPLQLILPTDRRARQVADQLLTHPDNHCDQTQLARQNGLSVRTLSRLSRQQTGISFSQWRQQAKVIASLSWIVAGEPVGQAALLSGFSNVSAYIEAFRERFGGRRNTRLNASRRNFTP